MLKDNITKAKEWFEIGDREFNFAKINLKEKENKFYAEICLLLQQAVEKYLKGYLVAQGIKPKKIHNNRELCLACAEINKEFEEFIVECAKLNKYYVAARYPVCYEIYRREDANKALKTAEKVIEFIKKDLGLK